MNLNPIKANMTEVDLGNGRLVLFSYKTAVAYSDTENLWYQTEKFWSETTTRHINQWMKSMGADVIQKMPQTFFDTLCAEVK